MSDDTPKHGIGDPEYEQEDVEKKTLTADFGESVPDNQNSKSAGPEGPLLMEDYPTS